jgi:anti-sigma regulatory factor (Ser/Thr protein kinase)
VVVIPIVSEIDSFIARRAGREMAREAGFSTRDYSLIEIAVSELASNVIKYGIRGDIRLKALAGGMEIICEDEGPGIAEPEKILARREKNKSGLGIGLLGVRNIMDQLLISTESGHGTKITARKWKVKPAHLLSKSSFFIPPAGLLEYGALTLSCQQGALNGDALLIVENPPQVLLAVLDGLGHGQEAHHASQKAAACIQANSTLPLLTLLEYCHAELRRTRGAVIGLARIDLSRSLLTCAGIGNIVIRIAGSQKKNYLSAPGILGHACKIAREEQFAFGPRDLFFMHSDGICDRFTEEPWSSSPLSVQHLAERIVQEYGKYHDDQSIIVARRKDAAASA